jgi:hypothetical protein
MVSNYEISEALKRLNKNVQVLHVKVDSLPSILRDQFLEEVRTLSFKAVSPSACAVLLSVAEEKTLEVLKGLDSRWVTADEVSFLTKRARAVESMYLNGLHRRKFVLKERQGRKVIFRLKEGDHA